MGEGPDACGPQEAVVGEDMVQTEDLYAVLGVDAKADPDEIDHAFKDRIKGIHPDLAEGAADAARRHNATVRLNQAATILRDPTSRAKYDLDRRAARVAAAQASARAAAPAGRPAAAATTPGRWAQPTPVAYAAGVPVQVATRRLDLFARRPAHTPSEWLRYNRLGQWLALFAVMAAASIISAIVSPADIGLATVRVGLAALVIGNIATRSLANPAGDLMRVVFKTLDWLMDRYRDQFIAKPGI